jgi:hypothetical protein
MLLTAHSFQYEATDIPENLTVSEWRRLRRSASQPPPLAPAHPPAAPPAGGGPRLR